MSAKTGSLPKQCVSDKENRYPEVDAQELAEQQPSTEQTEVQVRQAWRPIAPGDRSLNDILVGLGARYVWAYHNAFETLYFVDSQPSLRDLLLPEDERIPGEELEVRTLVSKQWVLPQVIDSFNMSFEVHDTAYYSIKGKLKCSIITELHDTSANVMNANIRTSARRSFLERRLVARQTRTPEPQSEIAPAPVSQFFHVKALWPCIPDQPGQLGFLDGDVINVIEEPIGDWWMGELDGRTGLFPANYVEEIPHDKVDEVRKEAEETRRQREEAERQRQRREFGDWMLKRQRENWLRDLGNQQKGTQEDHFIPKQASAVREVDASSN